MKQITKSLSLKSHCLLLNITDYVFTVLLILVSIENIHSYNVNKTLMLRKIVAGREGGNSGWNGWRASSTRRTRVWANSGRWWRTGKPGVLQFMGLQRVRPDLVTEQQQQCKQFLEDEDKHVHFGDMGWRFQASSVSSSCSHSSISVSKPSTMLTGLLPCHP